VHRFIVAELRTQAGGDLLRRVQPLEIVDHAAAERGVRELRRLRTSRHARRTLVRFERPIAVTSAVALISRQTVDA